ncbi:hypothetical protein RRG08_025408 [Elysia crispata]|uniref:Uncharacterized protein n=1 Tax=Elysia crispata TaxID=231223 RepID=A0AAE0Z9M2_9GAST|nr:hypothetical protein RRG08_025408 [Elysia crispata]
MRKIEKRGEKVRGGQAEVRATFMQTGEYGDGRARERGQEETTDRECDDHDEMREAKGSETGSETLRSDRFLQQSLRSWLVDLQKTATLFAL